MQLAVLGVGGAGCRIVDALDRSQSDRRTYLTGVRAFDTDVDALRSLSLSEDCCHGFGHLETEGAGTNGNRAVGGDAARGDAVELRRAADDVITSESDAILVVAGVGGGTGSGAAPILVDELLDVYDLPIYAVTVLPAAAEGDPAETNATAGTRELRAVVDAQLVFDDEVWLRPDDPTPDEEDAEDVRRRMNETLARRIEALFVAGESDVDGPVAESVVDASEIVNTLAGGGYVSLGYATQEVREPPSLLDRLLSREPDVDDVEAISAVESTLRRAVNGKLTMECTPDSAARALLVAGGPPEWLNRRALADGQRWLSGQIESAEIRSGDAPKPDGTHLSILVALAGIEQPERIDRTADS